ncbi:MAG: FecR domain-containing protein [bacterium]
MSERAECDAVRERFLTLEEGALGAGEVRQVQEHLASCEACRRAWEGWQADDRALREALQPIAPPRDVAGAALAKLRAEARGRRAARRRGILRWAAVVAAVVAVSVGIAVWRSGRHEQVGVVAETIGEPQVRQRGARRHSVVRAGALVYNGAELVTSAGEGMTVRFSDGSRLVMREGTKTQLSGTGEVGGCGHRLPHVCLLRGEVDCKLSSVRYFRGVGTPLGTAIVEGTRFRMRYVGQWTLLEVVEGVVQFSCPGGEVRARAGTVWVSDSRDRLPRKVSGVFD